MKQATRLLAGFLFLAAATAGAGEKRVSLLPRLQARQVLTYLIRYRSEKAVKTESHVVTPMAPDSTQTGANGLLRIEIRDVQQAGGKPVVHALARFLGLEAGAETKPPAGKNFDGANQGADSEGPSIEFTISQDGSAEIKKGADSLSPEQRQIWQEWVAHFAAAWVLPAATVKIGEKWRSEQAEQAASPIAGLHWLRETEYVRNEPCPARQLSIAGDVSPASGPPDTCAVLLTTAVLKQKSSPKDATPEDFKLHGLRTTGTARGMNEIITYISLKTGLVVRASEEASQFMDVVVAKTDASNRVHYNVDAKSRSEVLLVVKTPPSQP